MSLFDTYEPRDVLRCPRCGEALARWQGKDGPCARFVWREGEAAPASQDVDPEVRYSDEARAEIRLPSTFVIYSYDCTEHAPTEADGRVVDGVWQTTVVRVK